MKFLLNSVKVNNYYHYYSDRDIPLVYIESPSDRPIITVENYLKWYDLYCVLPDSSVKALGRNDWRTKEIENLANVFDEDYYGSCHYDHLHNPWFVQFVAEELKFDICYRSLEMIIGRWEIEYKQQYIKGKIC